MGIDSWIKGSSVGALGILNNVIEEGKKKKAAEIKVSVEDSKTVLKQIGAKAADVRAGKKQLQALSTQSETCWKGESGDALRALLAKAIKEQEAIAVELEDNAATMTQMVQHLINDDQELAEYFRSSSGRGSSGGGRRA